MSDFEPLLRNQFAAYRNDLAPVIQAAGPDAARSTVRRRRRMVAAAAAAVAVALVAAPIAALAGYDRATRPLPPAETGEPTPAPTPESTQTPDLAPTLTPSSPPSSPGQPPTAPDGRISRSQLLAARVDLPPWPSYAPPTCTADNVKLRSGPINEYLPALLDLAYGDVDADGATETIALIACRIGEAQAKQVVAYDRDTAGKIITLGRIVGTQDEIEDITDFAIEANGRVRVRVADLQPCCSTPAYWAQQQWRTYDWNGERFTQVDGPTAWGPDPRLTDLTMTAGELVLGPADPTGKRPGSVTLTVTNTGPVNVAKLGFAELATIGTPNGGDWSLCRRPESDGSGASCLVPGLQVGERRAYTFRFLIAPTTPDATGQDPAMGARVVHYDAENRYWQDLTPKNNRVTIRAGN
jgi:hypothetical protein